MKRILFLATACLTLIGVGTAHAGEEQIEICHMGTSITVAEPAVAAHLEHGDELCDCETIDDCAAQDGVLDDSCVCIVGAQSQACDPAGTCDTEFASCGGNENCVCATAPDGSGSCVDGTSPCDTPCPNGDSDCPAGMACIVESCCDGPVCGFICEP